MSPRIHLPSGKEVEHRDVVTHKQLEQTPSLGLVEGKGISHVAKWNPVEKSAPLFSTGLKEAIPKKPS